MEKPIFVAICSVCTLSVMRTLTCHSLMLATNAPLYLGWFVHWIVVIAKEAENYLGEDDVSSSLGSSCGTCHCNAHIGFLQGGCVIHAITCIPQVVLAAIWHRAKRRVGKHDDSSLAQSGRSSCEDRQLYYTRQHRISSLYLI